MNNRGNNPRRNTGLGVPAASELYRQMVRDQQRMQQTRARRIQAYRRREQARAPTVVVTAPETGPVLRKRRGMELQEPQEEQKDTQELRVLTRGMKSARSQEIVIESSGAYEHSKNRIRMTQRAFYSLFASNSDDWQTWFTIDRRSRRDHEIFMGNEHLQMINTPEGFSFMQSGDAVAMANPVDLAKRYIQLQCQSHPQGPRLSSFINQNEFVSFVARRNMPGAGLTTFTLIYDYEFKSPDIEKTTELKEVLGLDVQVDDLSGTLGEVIFSLETEDVIETIQFGLVDVIDGGAAKGFDVLGRFRWVPSIHAVNLADSFQIYEQNNTTQTIGVQLPSLKNDFPAFMNTRRLAVRNIHQSISYQNTCRLIGEMVQRVILEHAEERMITLMHYGLALAVNPRGFQSWKIASSMLSEWRGLSDAMLTGDNNNNVIKGSLFDTKGTPIVLRDYEEMKLSVDNNETMVNRRRYLAMIIATMYRVGQRSMGTRWFDTGRLSPITLMILYREVHLIMLFTIEAIMKSIEEQSHQTQAIIAAQLYSVLARPTVKYYAASQLSLLHMDCEMANLGTTADASPYIVGIVISDLCEWIAVNRTLNIATKWYQIQQNMKQFVRRNGAYALNQRLFSFDLPDNLTEVNRSGSMDTRLRFNRYSSLRWQQAFRDFLSKTTEMVHPQTLKEAFNRTGTNRQTNMKVISLASEINSYRTSIDTVRELINRELLDMFSRGSFGQDFEQVKKNVHMFRLFVGFQFSIYDTDSRSRTTMNHRSAGFQFRFQNFVKPGPQHRNIKFMPSSLTLLKQPIGGGPSIQVYTQDLHPDAVRMGDFINGDFVKMVHDMLHDELILDQMHYAFTASGSPDQDYNALFQEIQIDKDQLENLDQDIRIARELRSDQVKNQAVNIYLNQLTLITAPMYQNVLAPLLTSRPPRNPVVGTDETYAQSLLRQGQYDITAVKFLMAQRGMVQQMVQNITCVVAVAWYVMTWACNQYSDFVDMAFIRLNEAMKMAEERNNIVFWLQVARRFTKDILKIQVPIFLFFTSSCRVIQFSMGNGMNKWVVELMAQQQIVPDYPVVIVTGEFTAVAHAFVTEAQRLYEYIDYRANSKLRRNLDQFGSHRGFSLIRTNMYKNIYDPPVPVSQILQDVMQNVWALDIETYSAVGVQMDPYCIVIQSLEEVKLQAFGEPKDVRELFRDFMNNLKQSRNPKSESLTIYAHNGAKFDWVVLMSDLLQLFPQMKVAGRLTEAKFISIPSINLKLADFFLMVSSGLGSIAQQFQTQTQQTECEEIKRLSNVNDLTEDQKFKILEYCINDCQCLLECVMKFTQKMLIVSGAERLVQHKFILPPTSSKVAQNIFAAKYLRLNKLHGNLSMHIDEIEAQAYYGGITQVFTLKPQSNIHYIDVNSLYPAAMVDLSVSTFPAKPDDIQDFRWSMDNGDSESELTDHFLYDVQYFCFNQDAYGMLPVRLQKGGLLYPRMNKTSLGDWRAGVQLKALIQSGLLQELQIKRLLRYPDATNTLFKGYIEDIYKQKAQCQDGAQKTVYKLLLNQLYGKFAERTFDQRFIIRSEALDNNPQVLDKICTREINMACLSDLMYQQDQKNRSQIIELYEAAGRPYTKDNRIPQLSGIHKVDEQGKWLELVISKDPSDMQSIGKLKRIAMMTTAKARSIMIHALGLIYKELQNLCEHVFYMDTDSFFCSHEAYLVFQKHKLLSNSQLGQFKDEVKAPCKITDAQFFASKVYHYEVLNTQTGRRELKCQFKGMKKGLFQKPQECLKIYRDMMAPGEAADVKQQKWSRSFGHIVIQEVIKTTSSKPRRRVLQDGNTQSFLHQFQFEQVTNNKRVVMYDNGQFGYEEHIQKKQ